MEAKTGSSGGIKRGGGGLQTLDSFFTKKPKQTGEGSEAVNNPIVAPAPAVTETSSDSSSVRDIGSGSEFSSDIGNYIGRSDVDDHTKATLLQNHWAPPADYVFPHCVVNKKGKATKKYAQRSHLEKFHWLVLSDKDRGLYCKYCALFRSGWKNYPVKRLVKEPLTAFDDLLGVNGALTVHEKSDNHKSSVDMGKHFLLTYYKPALEITNQVSKQRQQQVEENRQRLRPIVKTIIFCGRNNISLRGHRDDGHLLEKTKRGLAQGGASAHAAEKLTDNEDEAASKDLESIVAADGNFRALLRFRIDAGDKMLESHIETAKSNATYISKTTQNELINACKEEIQQVILNRVKEAKLFSVIFDETTDVSCMSQLSLSFRYLHDGSIREDFLTFCDAYDSIRAEDTNAGNAEGEREERRLTGAALAHIVEDLVNKCGLELKYCVGIGTDSCSTMASEVKGAAAELRKKAVNAKTCPCTNHALNNSLAKSAKVTSCQNATGIMKKVVSFANASAKRHAVFKERLGASLQSLCETRWVERHDGHLQFQGDTLVKICEALQDIVKWNDTKTASEAACLYHALRSPDFLVATICLCDILGCTAPLSKFLQSETMDVKKAVGYVQDTIDTLEDKRLNAESIFSQLFSEIVELGSNLDTDIRIPRITSRQTQRANVSASTPEEYFRRTVYIPLLDNIVSDFKDRRSADVMNLYNLRIFLPRTSFTDEAIKIVRQVTDQYAGILGTTTGAESEYKLWVAKWKRESAGNLKTPPQNLLDIINECDKDMYPSVNCLLRLLATLPVSIATSERSFSSLRRLKTWLRASMGEERLAGLALLHVHRDIPVDIEAVITRFSKVSKRKIQFCL